MVPLVTYPTQPRALAMCAWISPNSAPVPGMLSASLITMIFGSGTDAT
jgi:hypothetical protein